jgi:hypothetical protein
MLFSWLNQQKSVVPNAEHSEVSAKTTTEALTGVTLPQLPEKQPQPVAEHPVRQWLKGAVKEVGLPQEFIVPEATTLRICVDTVQAYKPFTWESLAYLLSQMLRIERIEFVGSADTITNLPALPDVIMQLKHQYPAIHVCVVTTGESLLTSSGLALLRTPVDELCITLLAHQPSGFEQLSGQNISIFSRLQAAVYRYITHRRQLGNDALIKTITVTYVVNNHNYQRMIPDMLRQAEHLGVDTVRFVNTIPEQQLLAPSGVDTYTMWYEALQADDVEVATYFNTFPAQEYRVAIQWPTLLQQPTKVGSDGSTVPPPLQGCQAAFHTVTVNLGFQASACPRWQIGERETDWYPVWRGDFWHNEHFKAVRNIHNPENQVNHFPVHEQTGVLQSPVKFEACGQCPNRCQATEAFQLPSVNQHLLF